MWGRRLHAISELRTETVELRGASTTIVVFGFSIHRRVPWVYQRGKCSDWVELFRYCATTTCVRVCDRASTLKAVSLTRSKPSLRAGILWSITYAKTGNASTLIYQFGCLSSVSGLRNQSLGEIYKESWKIEIISSSKSQSQNVNLCMSSYDHAKRGFFPPFLPVFFGMPLFFRILFSVRKWKWKQQQQKRSKRFCDRNTPPHTQAQIIAGAISLYSMTDVGLCIAEPTDAHIPSGDAKTLGIKPTLPGSSWKSSSYPLACTVFCEISVK